MPFRHIVLLTFDDGFDVESLAEDLRAMATAIPEIRHYDVRIDVGVSEGNADLAVVADFDDQGGWETYRDHPDHVKLIAEKIRPHLVLRNAVQLAT